MVADDVQLRCPVHGDVEGMLLSEGPLSECWPWVLICEEEHDGHTVIVGYEWTGDDNETCVSTRWEDAPGG